jgi:mono/diheme cytochrome c family protein
MVGAAVGCLAVVLATAPQTSRVAAGSNAKALGAEVFASHGCAHCHGVNGVGGGQGPDLQLVRKRMNKAQIARQIHDGSKEMPAYGDQLSSVQIDDLVAYLHAKRKTIVKVPKPAADVQKPEPEDPN